MVRAAAILLDADYRETALYFASVYKEFGYRKSDCADIALSTKSDPGMSLGNVQDVALHGLGLTKAVLAQPVGDRLQISQVHERVGDCIVVMLDLPTVHAVACVDGEYRDAEDGRWCNDGREQTCTEAWVRSPAITFLSPLVLATSKRWRVEDED